MNDIDRLNTITLHEANESIHKLNDTHKHVMESIRALAYSHVAMQMHATNLEDLTKLNGAVSASKQSFTQLQGDIQAYMGELEKYIDILRDHAVQLQVQKAKEENK